MISIECMFFVNEICMVHIHAPLNVQDQQFLRFMTYEVTVKHENGAWNHYYLKAIVIIDK